MSGKDKNIVQEPQADYEKAEMDQLKNALIRTPSERFDMLMRLVKIGIMLKKAKVIHKPFPQK